MHHKKYKSCLPVPHIPIPFDTSLSLYPLPKYKPEYFLHLRFSMEDKYTFPPMFYSIFHYPNQSSILFQFHNGERFYITFFLCNRFQKNKFSHVYLLILLFPAQYLCIILVKHMTSLI